MKKILFVCFIMLFGITFLCAESLAVISRFEGKGTLIRNKKTVKLSVGEILQANDEISTATGSGVGFKFIDGNISVRLLSESSIKMSGQTENFSLSKNINLIKGSFYMNMSGKPDSLTIVATGCTALAKTSSLLAKINSNGQTVLIVMEGTADLITPIVPTIQYIVAGQTAIVDRIGVLTIQDTTSLDFSNEEYALLNPPQKKEPQSLTVPFTDSRGRIKYAEFSW